MKLSLTSNPKEVFDAPRGIALALIAGGLVQEVRPPIVPVDHTVKWQLLKGERNDTLYIKATCPVCHNSASIFGHVEGQIQPFRHCGRADECPRENSDAFFKWLAAHQPKKRDPNAPVKFGVNFI
jgi:ribosomal protein S27E